MKKGNFREVKSGGRFAQRSAGVKASGSPASRTGEGGEFRVACAGASSGSLGSRGEYAQHSAGSKK